MASKQPYECFVCKNNGFPAVMVYLAGKDEQGHAIRIEADGSQHIHKTKVPSRQQQPQPKQQQPQRQPPTAEHELKLIHARIDRVIQLLDSQNRMLTILLEQKSNWKT